ncbi:putative membrane protein [Altererythrobacter atlanticus]|uniref:Bestrophin, RFP-TM, chloride channel n=1 Tax=Croceibacterium atlanticum TaxID=1267766 RepID=A0A0F7KTS7_9SPHN|nr:bestrophin family ion channel [Croceibacterium atlanticum]AKH42974.1 Bestrophin, RFP-TM, chloride channel [Croceibacterium atlanticum]MBB5734069.1 putative membrane protein [Croceibacterium atlanticum]
MILRDKPTLFELAFAIRGSIVPIIAPQLMALMLFAAAMVWLHDAMPGFPDIDATAFTVFGVALSLFLGFRNNAAYDRWWEARKLWGGLLADLRNFARETQLFLDDREQQQRIIRLSLAFLHLHRINLRKVELDERTREMVGDLAKSPNPACAALDEISAIVGKARADGTLDGFGSRTLAERIASIAAQQAGCERIAVTPLPYVYSLLIYRTTFLYCLLLPLALVAATGWLTPFFVGIVGYVFLGLAEVTEDLSHPFGNTPNALPLDAICRTAEISLAPHLGETPPEPLRAQDYYLS